MKLFTIAILTVILTVMSISAQTMPPLEAGVSQALAKWRAAHYSDVRYKLNITLEKGAPLMRGEIEISVKLTDAGAKTDLILDWRTTQFANDKDKPSADVVKVNESVIKTLPDSGNFAYAIDKEHIIIAQRLLKAGENVIKINFASPIKTSGAAVTRYVDKEDGAEYVYSLFVPSDASTAFPVFDQPDLKARFQLNLRIPLTWKAISNTEGSLPFNSASTKNPTNGTIIFEETKPISTYVFAFAAGEFAEFVEVQNVALERGKYEALPRGVNFDSILITSQPSNIKTPYEPARIYVRKSQAEKFKQHAAEVFRLNREGIKYLETYFDYKFPFPKYDLVLIPEFPFGGMEHAGATFLREDRVIFPTEPTKNDFITRANVIFHEAAHQWFGDTVTMRWFDDLWLKEGFAEFMAYKTLEKVMPEYNAWKIFYERNKQAAYLTDSTRGTTPIYQEIPNLSAAKSAYGNIVYRKAPSFLRQAEFYLGEDKFQTAVRQFLKKHEFANAEWTDLVREFETASQQDLKEWANVWVKQKGLSIIRPINSTIESKSEFLPNFKNEVYLFEQKGIDDKYGLWKMRLNVLYKNEQGANKIEVVNLNGLSNGKLKNTKDFDLFSQSIVNGNTDKSKENIVLVFPNYQDYGYGIFLLDEKSRAYVLANIQTEKDDFLRTMMWGALWDSVREGELNPKDYVELVIKNFELSEKSRRPTSVQPMPDGKPPVYPETDVSTISTLLGRVGTAMNYYVSDEQRKELAPRLEETLRNNLMSWFTPEGERITVFRAYLNLASTAESRQMLKSILEVSRMKAAKPELKNSRDLIDVPPLRTKDYFDILTKLLILGDEDAPRILAELEKTETSDEAKRYAYAAKAGIAAKENKAKFWNDFINNKELSESWIEAAFVPFNSTRHAELTLPYLEKALAELPNLKKNRKIFFVNGWLAAFIGGQRSEQALQIVNKFLADNPNLDKDLRLKILENADNLERAVKIRGRFQDK